MHCRGTGEGRRGRYYRGSRHRSSRNFPYWQMFYMKHCWGNADDICRTSEPINHFQMPQISDVHALGRTEYWRSNTWKHVKTSEVTKAMQGAMSSRRTWIEEIVTFWWVSRRSQAPSITDATWGSERACNVGDVWMISQGNFSPFVKVKKFQLKGEVLLWSGNLWQTKQDVPVEGRQRRANAKRRESLFN